MDQHVKIGLAVTILFCLSVIFVDVGNGGACPYIPSCNACTKNPQSNRHVCTECDPMHAPGENENGFSRCFSCSKDNSGCLFCKTFEKCDRCMSGKDGPDSNGRATCSACGPNCISCRQSGSGKCDRCTPGCRKVGTDCIKCGVENCNYCDTSPDTCGTCLSGYYLENNECKKCLDNCDKCRNDNTCDYCKSRFFYEIDSKSCKPCIANCYQCSDLDQCTTCNTGYYKDSDNKCTPCDETCFSCTSADKCLACKRGKPVDGSCKCSPNCKSCSTYGKCDSCVDGFVQDKNKQCKQSCPENCQSCSLPNHCETCASGFVLTENGQCSGVSGDSGKASSGKGKSG